MLVTLLPPIHRYIPSEFAASVGLDYPPPRSVHFDCCVASDVHHLILDPPVDLDSEKRQDHQHDETRNGLISRCRGARGTSGNPIFGIAAAPESVSRLQEPRLLKDDLAGSPIAPKGDARLALRKVEEIQRGVLLAPFLIPLRGNLTVQGRNPVARKVKRRDCHNGISRPPNSLRHRCQKHLSGRPDQVQHLVKQHVGDPGIVHDTSPCGQRLLPRG